MTAPITLVATAAMASPRSTPETAGALRLATGAGRGGAGAGAAGAAGAAAALAGADFALAAGAEAGFDAALPGVFLAPGAGTGILMVDEAFGLGGREILTVSFFGWTFDASAALGGVSPLGGFADSSDISGGKLGLNSSAVNGLTGASSRPRRSSLRPLHRGQIPSGPPEEELALLARSSDRLA